MNFGVQSAWQGSIFAEKEPLLDLGVIILFVSDDSGVRTEGHAPFIAEALRNISSIVQLCSPSDAKDHGIFVCCSLIMENRLPAYISMFESLLFREEKH